MVWQALQAKPVWRAKLGTAWACCARKAAARRRAACSRVVLGFLFRMTRSFGRKIAMAYAMSGVSLGFGGRGRLDLSQPRALRRLGVSPMAAGRRPDSAPAIRPLLMEA